MIESLKLTGLRNIQLYTYVEDSMNNQHKTKAVLEINMSWVSTTSRDNNHILKMPCFEQVRNKTADMPKMIL